MKDFKKFKDDMKEVLSKMPNSKTLDDFIETTTTADAGIPKDTATMGKPKKYKMLTRTYIEILGKRKKAIKDSKYKY